MGEHRGPENSHAARRDLDAALQRLLEQAQDHSSLVDPRTLRCLALDVVTCCDQIAMAQTIDEGDGHADDAFARFMHGDGERALIAFAN